MTGHRTARPRAAGSALALAVLAAVAAVTAAPAADAAPGVPSAPRTVTARPANASAVVSWSVPVSNGGSPITRYTASCASSGRPTSSVTVTAPAVRATVPRLINGVAYTCKVTASNARGSGPASAASPAVVPAGRPGAPRSVAASTQAGTLTARWLAPATTGGVPVSAYAVACASTDGGVALSGSTDGQARSLALAGLPDNRTYACTVTARGPGGVSPGARTAYVMHAALTPAAPAAAMHVPVQSGQRASLLVLGSTLPSDCTTELVARDPDGSDLAHSCVQSGAQTFVPTPRVPGAGTLIAELVSSSTSSGSAELVAWVFLDRTGQIAIGGPVVSVVTAVPGQNATNTFPGISGQQVSLDVSGSTAGLVDVSLLGPDGTRLDGTVLGSGSERSIVDDVTLPSTGTYTILLRQEHPTTFTARLALFDVSANTGTIAVDGDPVVVSIAVGEQNAFRTFAASAEQKLRLDITGNTVERGRVEILGPDGTSVAWTSFASGQDTALATGGLRSTGTYTVLVDPEGAATGSLTLQLTNYYVACAVIC